MDDVRPTSPSHDAIGPITTAAVTREYLNDFAVRHCTAVLFGPSLDGGRKVEVAAFGTATLLNIDRRLLIVTNEHVLAEYERLCATPGARIHFQVGKAAFDPMERLVDRASGFDICTFDASGLEINDRLPIDPLPMVEFYVASSWPPQRPVPGERFMWTGFPSSLRHVDAGTRFTVPLTFTGARVTRVDGRNIVCNLDPDRRDIRIYHGDDLYVDSPALRDLGGMSGGPAFVDRDGSLRPELVGIVREYYSDGAQTLIARLDAIKLDGTLFQGSLD